MAEKIPCKRIEVDKLQGSLKKNGFMWRRVIASRKKKSKNVLYGGVGYDTYQSALKQAKAHNKQLLKPLRIFHRGKEVK